MKIAIVNSVGETKSLYDHTIGNELNSIHGCEGVFLDNPLLADGSVDLPLVNSCIGVQNIILNENLKSSFMESVCGTRGDKLEEGGSTLYTLFNGEAFSDFLEVNFSGKFMTGNIGPDLGFVHGVGIKCDSNIYDAFPVLIKFREAFNKLQYRGEILFAISSDYRITGVKFGHSHAHFCLYAELCQNTVQDCLEYLFGKVNKITLHESIAVANLVTLSPYPSRSLNTQTIHAPKGAEKHLWRSQYGNGETVLVVCHGGYLNEARKRIRRTIENMLAFNPELQYRLDYGLRMGFVFNGDKYKAFEEATYTPKVSVSPAPQIQS